MSLFSAGQNIIRPIRSNRVQSKLTVRFLHQRINSRRRTVSTENPINLQVQKCLYGYPPPLPLTTLINFANMKHMHPALLDVKTVNQAITIEVAFENDQILARK